MNQEEGPREWAEERVRISGGVAECCGRDEWKADIESGWGTAGGSRYGSSGSAIWGELEGSTEGDWARARKLPAERGE